MIFMKEASLPVRCLARELSGLIYNILYIMVVLGSAVAHSTLYDEFCLVQPLPSQSLSASDSLLQASALRGSFPQSHFVAHLMNNASQNDLIFDIGFNMGGDSLNYLSKGYRVVALEADPQLVEAAKNNPLFAKEFQSGRLHLIHAAVAKEGAPATLPFWQFNDPTSEGVWGSIGHPHQQCSAPGACSKVADVPTISCEKLLHEHGVPIYIKIDIEGADDDCVLSISRERTSAALPKFLSMEGQGYDAIHHLRCLGYAQYKTVAQAAYNIRKPDNPYQHSGPFGDEAVDVTTSKTAWLPWQSDDSVVKDQTHDKCTAPDWCDLHVMRSDEQAPHPEGC